jgi:hypothetical protein
VRALNQRDGGAWKAVAFVPADTYPADGSVASGCCGSVAAWLRSRS